jgi:hypothetical protein
MEEEEEEVILGVGMEEEEEVEVEVERNDDVVKVRDGVAFDVGGRESDGDGISEEICRGADSAIWPVANDPVKDCWRVGEERAK